MKIGTDIVEVDRIEKFQHINKLFFESEITYASERVLKFQHLAGFYCAKEAVIKALEGGSVKEIEILHKTSGAPYVKLYGETKKLLNNREIEVSISHIKKIAMAVCIVND